MTGRPITGASGGATFSTTPILPFGKGVFGLSLWWLPLPILLKVSSVWIRLTSDPNPKRGKNRFGDLVGC